MSFHDKKLAEAIKEAAGGFINRCSDRTSLITVTNISLSRDKHLATIFISVLPETKEETALGFVNRKRNEFREFVKVAIKTRMLPSFNFALDEGEKNRQKIDKISGGA